MSGAGDRYESIHMAAQYQNNGTMQIAVINENGITMGLNEDEVLNEGVRHCALQCRTKVRPLHESFVKVPQRVSGFDCVEKFTIFDSRLA